jgi:uncharacterized membrane protein YdbT with pleckstrin-like domain
MANGYLKNLLGKNEQIILISRQHWLVYLQAIVPELAIIILMIVGLSVSIISFQKSWIWFLTILLLLPLLSILRDTLIWLNRQYVITNRRVIQVSGIVNKDVTDSSLEKVNDVKLVQSFWGRLLGYGNIHIMTAAELGINLFSRIADPVRFKTTMLDAKVKEESEIGDVIASSVRSANIPDMILRLGELRDKGLISEEEFQSKKQSLLNKITG